MDNHKSCIIPQQRDTDFLKGTIPFEIRATDGNWRPFLPDFDKQKIAGLETDACVPFSAVESVETQINWFIASGKLPSYHLQKLKDLGFIEPNGQFHASERFIAKLDGTSPNGTAMAAPWDAIRKYGLIPFSDYPFDANITTWEQFYATVPQALLDKGKEFSKLFSVQYEWIVNGGASGTDVQDMKTHLKHAPLCIGVPVCEPWDQEQPPTCSLTQSAHSTMAYNVDGLTYFLDHYVPFLKRFDLGYYIPYVMKGVVNIIPVPVVPATPIPSVPTNVAPTQNNVNVLTIIVSLYQAILVLIKGRQNLGSTSMNYNLLRSKTFWTIVFQFASNGFLAISGNFTPQTVLILNGVLTTLASIFHLQTGQSTTGTN